MVWAVTAGGVMSGVRRIVGLPSGRRTKWVVLGFWIVVFAVAGPLAGKLNSAQQNDSSAWLPHNAESTQVVELAKQFSPSDVFPALVVYERADGAITPADQAKAAADARRFRWSCRSRSPRRATAGRSWPRGSRRCAPSRGPTPAGWGCT